MLVRADENRFVNAAEFGSLPNLKIGTQAGTTSYFTAVNQILGGDAESDRLILFRSFGASVQALLNGDVDVVLTDTATGKGYVGANPDKLKLTGPALSTENFGFILTDRQRPYRAIQRGAEFDDSG